MPPSVHPCVEHMKHRCYFMYAMCSMSLYGWWNYSLFDPIDNSVFTPYYLNCLLMLLYLGWDTYRMMTNHALYRTDLMIHHSITTVVYVSCINHATLQMSHVLIMECISLMNHAWRNHPTWLKLYRALCIVCIRVPLSFWMWLCYNPTVMHPHFQRTRTHNHYLYLSTLCNVYAFFVIYDMFILLKLYKRNENAKLSLSR
jgi:hypothetical protein